VLENAVRHPGRAPVRVVLEQRDGDAVLTVRDFGPGIPADRLPHVFEPLFEPWPPGSAWYTGVIGMGLYLARTVVRAHGGDLVASGVEGEGSTFVLSRPTGAGSHPPKPWARAADALPI